MWGFIASLFGNAVQGVVSAFLGVFFPSKDEQLGTAKQAETDLEANAKVNAAMGKAEAEAAQTPQEEIERLKDDKV